MSVYTQYKPSDEYKQEYITLIETLGSDDPELLFTHYIDDIDSLFVLCTSIDNPVKYLSEIMYHSNIEKVYQTLIDMNDKFLVRLCSVKLRYIHNLVLGNVIQKFFDNDCTDIISTSDFSKSKILEIPLEKKYHDVIIEFCLDHKLTGMRIYKYICGDTNLAKKYIDMYLEINKNKVDDLYNVTQHSDLCESPIFIIESLLKRNLLPSGTHIMSYITNNAIDILQLLVDYNVDIKEILANDSNKPSNEMITILNNYDIKLVDCLCYL
jgi:hypothetical protein